MDRALEVTSWLQQAYQELSESRMATEESSFAEKYQVKHRGTERKGDPHVCYFITMLQPFELCLLPQVFQDLANSFAEQRRPVMTLLAAIKRRPELSQEQRALRTAWDRLEEEVRRIHLDWQHSYSLHTGSHFTVCLRGGDWELAPDGTLQAH